MGYDQPCFDGEFVSSLAGARERLEVEYHLWVLRLSMGNWQVHFNLSCGGEQLALLTASPEEIGIPCSMNFPEEGDEGLEAERFKLPPHVISSLKSLLSDPDNRAPSLWLRLSKPVGLLTAVPWEHLLQPLLGIPVLRLPYHLIRPREPREEIDTVICFSSPATEAAVERDLVDQVTGLIPSDLARLTNFHLFADRAVYDHLIRLQRTYHGKYRIIVYSPPMQKLRGNPWFSWITESLRLRSADVVHFLCHSHRVREEGCLVMATSPTGNSTGTTNLVYAEEVVEFLNRIGAWSLALTAPPNNYCAASMLMLLDSVAQLRPGPGLLHEMKHPDSGTALGAAYRFLYQAGQQAPSSPAISLYCHPSREDAHDEEAGALLSQYTLAGKLGLRLADSSQPVWLASAQRILEASAGEVAAELEADPNSGRARARQFVVDALVESADDETDAAAGPSVAGVV